VPPAGSGLSNIFFSNNIPAANAFTLQLGTLSFNLSNGLAVDAPYGTEYNNGAFNGFDFISNFNFSNTEYQLQIDGGVLSVLPVDQNGNPILTDSSLINATVNIGNSSLTNEKLFVLAPVPLAGSFARSSRLWLAWRYCGDDLFCGRLGSSDRNPGARAQGFS
jgi:hypothetical protein